MGTETFISPAVKTIWMAAILFFCACAGLAQGASSPTIEEVYLAKDDGNGKAGDQALEFAPTDVPIHCVVMLGLAAKVTVKMNFVAVAVPGVRADTKVVSASYTTTDTQNRVNFTGRPDGWWTPGRYRVDIFIDGKPQKELEFAIKGTPVSMPAATKFLPAVNKPKRKTRN